MPFMAVDDAIGRTEHLRTLSILSFESNAMTQPGNDNLSHLSEILNKLAKRGLGVLELETERNALAAASKTFNGAAATVITKIADALPDVTDNGSRWIMARMLRDLGLKNETDAETALKTLVTCFQSEKDAGTRAMACGQMREIALAYEPLSGMAAAAIALHLMAEKDAYARNTQKNALLSIGMAYEAAAPTTVSFIGNMLATENDPASRMTLSTNLQEIAAKYPSQAKAVIAQLSKTAEEDDNKDAQRKYAQDIGMIGFTNPGATALSIAALAEGFKRGGTVETTAAYSHNLLLLGLNHPMAVIAEIDSGMKNYDENQRRMSAVSLTRLADIGKPEATASAAVMMAALKDEDSSYNRRLLVQGLMTAVRNKADEAQVLELFKREFKRERDKETRELLDRSLRHLGFITPVPVLVPLRPVN